VADQTRLYERLLDSSILDLLRQGAVAAARRGVEVALLIDGFGSKVATDAIEVSLKTNAIAFALMIGLGTPLAYVLARTRFRGRSVVITLVEVPLVMPPAVAGLALLVAFGRLGLLGNTLSALGIDLAFTQAAVVIAILFVASPFYLRGATAAFEAASTWAGAISVTRPMR